VRAQNVGTARPKSGEPRPRPSEPRPARAGASRQSIRPRAERQATIAVIERRALIRECLVKCLESNENCIVRDFATVDDWLDSAAVRDTTVVVLCTQGREERETERDLARLSQEFLNVPVVIVSDAENSEQILAAVE